MSKPQDIRRHEFTMSKAQRERRRAIIAQLVELSRKGWANARPTDYEPLERELREIEGRS